MNIQTAGARLKQLRLEKGISLEEVQKKTKIHLNVLRAIEGDSLSDLSPIYLKSFIKIYCNCLGVDSKDYLGASTQAQAAPVLNSKVGRPVGQRTEKERTFIKDAAVKINSLRPPQRFNKLIFFVVLAVVVILAATKLFSLFTARKTPRSMRAEKNVVLSVSASLKQRTPAGVQRKTAASSKDNAVAFKMQKEITSGFTLGILAKNKCWISLKVDGHLVFHGVLAKGRFESWKAKDKIELSLGDAAAVELQVNDQRFPNLGRRGQVLRNILINKEGLKIAR